MIYVVNKYTHITTNNDIVIMRPSIWGNPYSHKVGTLAKYKVKTRHEAVTKHRDYLIEEYGLKQRLYTELITLARRAKAQDIYLVCCCAPQECHGTNIKEAVEWIISKGKV